MRNIESSQNGEPRETKTIKELYADFKILILDPQGLIGRKQSFTAQYVAERLNTTLANAIDLLDTTPGFSEENSSDAYFVSNAGIAINHIDSMLKPRNNTVAGTEKKNIEFTNSEIEYLQAVYVANMGSDSFKATHPLIKDPKLMGQFPKSVRYALFEKAEKAGLLRILEDNRCEFLTNPVNFRS